MPTKSQFLSGSFFYNRKLALLLWFGLPLLGAYRAFTQHGLNNFLIFRDVYYHTLHSQNLYALYPGEYNDVNLYGPFFSIVIAPFAWLPVKTGAVLWVIANAAFLFFAICKLPFEKKWHTVLLFLCCHELLISSGSLQVNPLVCSCILLGFAYTNKNKEFLALFFIMAATFIKIYGIVGFAFFFFSKRRLQFMGWAISWSIFFFFTPLLITNFSFLFHSYQDWFLTLRTKNAKNLNSVYQNVAVSGMIRRIFGLPRFNELLIVIPAAILFASQYMWYAYFNDIRYRLYILCSVLIATVIFSTGAESATYIVVMPGICIWYLLQPKKRGTTIFFVVAFIVTTFAYTDILTPWSRHYLYRPYSVKAFMPFVIWLIIFLQIHTKQFLKANVPGPVTKPIISVN